MTIGNNIILYIKESINSLYEPREAAAIAREIAAHFFGISLTQAYAQSAHTLTDEEQQKLAEIISRLRNNEPVQYITGEATFMGRSFHVAPGVLIPRPETEDLVQKVLEHMNDGEQALQVADAGCGSGCIAISLKLARPSWNLIGIDCSKEALAQAQENANTLQAPVSFMEADLREIHTLPLCTLNAIVSNPPYIPQSERYSRVAPNVKGHEPEIALFVPDEDALLFYRQLAIWGQKTLTEGGRIFVELHPDFAKETAQLFSKHHFHNITIEKDRFGKERILACQK